MAGAEGRAVGSRAWLRALMVALVASSAFGTHLESTSGKAGAATSSRHRPTLPGGIGTRPQPGRDLTPAGRHAMAMARLEHTQALVQQPRSISEIANDGKVSPAEVDEFVTHFKQYIDAYQASIADWKIKMAQTLTLDEETKNQLDLKDPFKSKNGIWKLIEKGMGKAEGGLSVFSLMFFILLHTHFFGFNMLPRGPIRLNIPESSITSNFGPSSNPTSILIGKDSSSLNSGSSTNSIGFSHGSSKDPTSPALGFSTSGSSAPGGSSASIGEKIAIFGSSSASSADRSDKSSEQSPSSQSLLDPGGSSLSIPAGSSRDNTMKSSNTFSNLKSWGIESPASSSPSSVAGEQDKDGPYRLEPKGIDLDDKLSSSPHPYSLVPSLLNSPSSFLTPLYSWQGSHLGGWMSLVPSLGSDIHPMSSSQSSPSSQSLSSSGSDSLSSSLPTSSGSKPQT